MECLGELWAFLDVISDSCEPFVGSGLEARNQPGLEFNQSIYIYIYIQLSRLYVERFPPKHKKAFLRLVSV